jgi:hypothetical protein
MAQAATLRLWPVLVRATVWSLIGMIYAPLYLVLAGLGMGTLAGTALLAADRLAGVMLPTPAALAFLVCVTAVLCVSVLVTRPAHAPGRGRFCDLSEGLVIAVIGVVTANALAGFAGIFSDGEVGRLTNVLLEVSAVLSAGLFAAMFAGAVAGGLLELFEFDWVDRA